MRLAAKFFGVLFLAFAHIAMAQENANQAIPLKVTDDVHLLFHEVLAPNTKININWKPAKTNTAQLKCSRNNSYDLNINSTEHEASATLYYLVRKVGFIFPHPRMTIKPTPQDIRKLCNHNWEWKPRLRNRGFHLHTMHPSEWVAGYYMGYDQIAEDTNRWLVRNQQNYLDVQMIQLKENEKQHLIRNLKDAKSWGLEVGLSASFALIQQRSYKLIPLWRVLTHYHDTDALKENLKKFVKEFPVDFVAFELGSSEFTPTRPDRTIAWMNAAAEVLKPMHKKMFIKVHTSNNQHDAKYGNFNFLPQYADPYVGIFPHTTFFYGLNDEYTPMYHRENLADMKDFYLKQAPLRDSFYYPETSYFIFMDVDAPLFLTDYLLARTDDVDWMQDNHLDQHINFSTGQEVGYWLFDYQVSLLADPESRHNPYFALELIGEKRSVWEPIINWQHEYIKKKQLIQALFFPNLIDETPFAEPVHKQLLIRDIPDEKIAAAQQIRDLTTALQNRPDFRKVQNEELRLMLEVTELRMEHALCLRKAALLNDQESFEFERLMNEAARLRTEAFNKMDIIFKKHNRYPEVPLSQYWKNPTSYGFGYLITSRTLSLWEREEQIVKEHHRNPLFKSIVNPLRIILPRWLFEFFDWF